MEKAKPSPNVNINEHSNTKNLLRYVVRTQLEGVTYKIRDVSNRTE